MRPLPAPILLALALATALGLEAWARVAYRTQDGLLEKARRFSAEAREADRNLVILGTCLPAQHIQAHRLQANLDGWVVHNLGQEATNSLDWYLAYANELPASRVDAVIVAYGEHDLLTRISPWESRVLDLARWGDVPTLASHACDRPDCRTDLAMRKASVLWRNRIRLSNRLWLALGALPREAPLTPPVGEDLDGPRYYLDALVASVRAHGTPLWFLPLPRRPEPGRPPPPVDTEARGVERIRLEGLVERDFEGETHLTEAGAARLTVALAAALGPRLKSPVSSDVSASPPPAGGPRP